MRIGLVSDIHANLPALEAVLDDMPSVDALVCAGDVIGYNPWPVECVRVVREEADVVVQGNHDRVVETPERYAANRMAEAGLAYAKRHLSSEALEWLCQLPTETSVAGGRYRVVHSHPTREDAYVYPGEFPNMARYLDDGEGLVLGHTHVQGAERVEGHLVVNPGSVGQPRDGDPRAAYAVLDTEGDAGGSEATAEDAIDLRRVEYDVERVVEAVEDAGLPERTGERLRGGE